MNAITELYVEMVEATAEPSEYDPDAKHRCGLRFISADDSELVVLFPTQEAVDEALAELKLVRRWTYERT